MLRDGMNDKQVVHLGNLALSGVTPAVSAYVDMQGWGKCTFVLVANTITDAGAAAGFTATMQESEDTTAAAAATVDTSEAVEGVVTLSETLDTNDDTVIGMLGYLGGERYAGISITGTTDTDADVSVLAILENPSIAPTTAVGTAVART